MPRYLPAIPLRLRTTLLYVVLGVVMSALFAGVMLFFTEDYEHVLVEEILNSQAEDYSARLRTEPDSILPRGSRLSGYVRHRDGSGEVPDDLAALAPGVHESADEDENGQHMGVFDTPVGRLYFTINLQDIERLEDHLHWTLAAVMIIGTLISAWLGWILSRGVVRPVRRLADAVDALPAEPVQTDLAAMLPDDQLGRLGKAIDNYQSRLLAGQQAEHAFFADASHELRTPIAVVRGATELLIEDGAAMPTLQPRLRRLDRGVRQLSDLLDAMLGLARRRIGASETVHLRDWLSSCLAETDAIRDGTLVLDLQGDNPHCSLPPHEAALVLNGIVRQVTAGAKSGRLLATIDGKHLTLQWVAHQREDASWSSASGTSSDRGFAMTLIGRLASHLGWRLDEDLSRHRVRIQLPDQTDSPDARSA